MKFLTFLVPSLFFYSSALAGYPQGPIIWTEACAFNLITQSCVPANNGGTATWGDIDGTLANQTDLQNALNLKLSANQTITLSGSVTGSGTTAITATIGTNVVTNAMRAQMTGSTLKCNTSGSTANEADCTASQVHTLLGETIWSVGNLDSITHNTSAGVAFSGGILAMQSAGLNIPGIVNANTGTAQIFTGPKIVNGLFTAANFEATLIKNASGTTIFNVGTNFISDGVDLGGLSGGTNGVDTAGQDSIDWGTFRAFFGPAGGQSGGWDDEEVYGIHLAGNTSPPTITAGAGAGTSPTVTVTGNDVDCIVTIRTGTLPAIGIIATVTYNTAFENPPVPVFSAASAPSASLSGPTGIFMTSPGSTTFVINSGLSALQPSNTYVWNVHTLE